uniref:hypothetical protein n=1 Tax=Thaumasiovibrio subtropicus TaxID=1891207 RepID=UPI00131C979D
MNLLKSRICIRDDKLCFNDKLVTGNVYTLLENNQGIVEAVKNGVIQSVTHLEHKIYQEDEVDYCEVHYVNGEPLTGYVIDIEGPYVTALTYCERSYEKNFTVWDEQGRVTEYYNSNSESIVEICISYVNPERPIVEKIDVNKVGVGRYKVSIDTNHQLTSLVLSIDKSDAQSLINQQNLS